MNNIRQDNAGSTNMTPLLHFFGVVFERKLVVLSFLGAVVGLVALVTFLMPPVFQAKSTILVEREMDSEKALLFGMNLSLGYETHDWISSECEIIRSYPVAARVIDALGLHDSEGEDSSSNGDASGQERVMRAFLRKLKVQSAAKSNVISVSYEGPDAQKVTDIVRAVIDTYINYRSEVFNESESFKFFEEQMHIADEKLRTLEQRQASYKEGKQLISPEAQREILLTRLADYERSLTAVRTARIGKEARIGVIKDHWKDGQSGIPSTESSDSPSQEKHIAKLRGELLDLELQREQLLTRFTPEYKKVVDLETQINATKLKIENEIEQIVAMEESAISALRAEEDALQSSIHGTKREIEELAKREYEFSQISRGIDDSRQVYSTLLKQREEARISLAKLQKGVRIEIISPAMVPSDPIKPRKKINIALGMLLGVAGGLSLAFVLDYLDHSVTNPSELERRSGLRVLGSIRDVGTAV